MAALGVGAMDYLMKPLDVEQLVWTIDRALACKYAARVMQGGDSAGASGWA